MLGFYLPKETLICVVLDLVSKPQNSVSNTKWNEQCSYRWSWVATVDSESENQTSEIFCFHAISEIIILRLTDHQCSQTQRQFDCFVNVADLLKPRKWLNSPEFVHNLNTMMIEMYLAMHWNIIMSLHRTFHMTQEDKESQPLAILEPALKYEQTSVTFRSQAIQVRSLVRQYAQRLPRSQNLYFMAESTSRTIESSIANFTWC